MKLIELVKLYLSANGVEFTMPPGFSGIRCNDITIADSVSVPGHLFVDSKIDDDVYYWFSPDDPEFFSKLLKLLVINKAEASNEEKVLSQNGLNRIC